MSNPSPYLGARTPPLEKEGVNGPNTPSGWKHACVGGLIRTVFAQPCAICGKLKHQVSVTPFDLSTEDVEVSLPPEKPEAPQKDYPPNLKYEYFSLSLVLQRAWEQAALGKGAARHGQNLPFEEQPMLAITRTLGSHAGLLYQAAKKAQESQRMDKDAAVAELLGAINYLAGAIIYLEEKDGKAP